MGGDEEEGPYYVSAKDYDLTLGWDLHGDAPNRVFVVHTDRKEWAQLDGVNVSDEIVAFKASCGEWRSIKDVTKEAFETALTGRPLKFKLYTGPRTGDVADEAQEVAEQMFQDRAP